MIVRDCGTGEEVSSRLLSASVTESGPLFSTITLKAEASCCPRVTLEITLYHAIKRIDFNARVLRDSTPTKEVFFAFPFQMENPQFHFEASNAVIEPIRDQIPGSNTDSYAVQHWAEVSNGEWGIVWTAVDAPMVEFGGLWPGYVSSAHHYARGPNYGHQFLKLGELEKGHIYSLVSYNNFGTNFIKRSPVRIFGALLVQHSRGRLAGRRSETVRVERRQSTIVNLDGRVWQRRHTACNGIVL